MKSLYLALILLLSINFSTSAQQTTFNADSAFANTYHLAVTIGPRPMGSLNERKALQWAADRFKKFGADTAYIMPFYEAPGGVNTTSGISIGVFKGKTDSIIVIGGHIDSDSRINPGASDNASGTATVIEMARNWAKVNDHHYTLLFAAFGGEEAGLIGSKYFVKNYKNIDDVALMFSIDMASTPGWLIPFIDIESHQSPKWLVKDAYAIDRTLGYEDLEYPTHFFTVNSALGGAGSDHMPFMEADIPAIDFTAGINIDPIHTPQDQIEFVDKNMLARSGKLVSGMVEKYMATGIPSTKKDNFMLIETWFGNLYFPSWLISGFVFLGLFCGIGVFLQAAKFARNSNTTKVRLSGMKLFIIMIIIALGMLSGEAVLQILKGYRYAWLTHFQQYMWLAAISTVLGIWVGLQLTRYWKISENAFAYVVRAAVLLIIYTAVFAMTSLRMAAYPAFSLLILFLMVNFRLTVLQIICAFLIPLPLFHLAFIETLPFMARALSVIGLSVNSFLGALIYTSALAGIITLWFLPVLYSWSFLVRFSPAIRAFVEQFRKPISGIAIFIIWAVFCGYVFGLPAFSERWQPMLMVKATYDVDADTSSVMVNSNEFLKDITVKSVGFNETINQDKSYKKLPLTFSANWMSITGNEQYSSGEKDTLIFDWQLKTDRQWVRADVTIKALEGEIEPLIEDINYAKSHNNEIRMRWENDPADSIRITGKIVFSPGATLVREVQGDYGNLPIPFSITSKFGKAAILTEVFKKDTLNLK